MKGLISDIQKFSLHDGPGIRTTVFVKGCNMKCIWCHNPEGISTEPQLIEYSNKCINCGKCAEVCEYNAMSFENGIRIYYRDNCVCCGKCADVCPSGALAMVGTWREVDDVFEELASDIPYYGKSGGGVTISGGEPLMQVDFCAELLRKCWESGIDTAIETNLSMPFDRIERLLPWLNRIFFDIKTMDDEIHRELTGVTNKTVLENSLKLSKTGITTIVRTPLIPGITDSVENIKAISKWVSELKNVEHLELLNYNLFAMSKYEPVGLIYQIPNAKPLSSERVAMLGEIAKQAGIEVKYEQG